MEIFFGGSAEYGDDTTMLWHCTWNLQACYDNVSIFTEESQFEVIEW